MGEIFGVVYVALFYMVVGYILIFLDKWGPRGGSE